ncbi:permease prefix domain 1-containing protein [Microbacterium sp. RD1]|uniref:permease prefix domain 1-containing protein n=1 Tax=Microbacterium sp. RD1 TaxID=3457313 RepID=UPI003FA55BD0
MTTLTDRYVAAAMRSVPEKQRPDLGAELHASIVDQVDARVGAGEAPDVAERAVLTQLGDPDTLAAGYVDRPLHLIGPRYFLPWWRLTKLLWAIVPACAAFGVALAQVLAGAGFGQIVGAVVSVVIAVIVHIGFWTTVVFAIVERSSGSAGAGLVGSWSIDDLPQVRESGAKLSDLIASLVFLAVAAGAVLWDLFVGFAFLPDGERLSFLHPGLAPWWIGGLFVVLALEALLAIWVYARGRWAGASATVNLLLNVAIVVPIVWLLLQQRILNPDFFPALIPADGSTVASILATVFGFGVVAVGAWDSIDGFRKARRSR